MWFGCERWDCGVEGITAAEGALYRSGDLCEEPVAKTFKAGGPWSNPEGNSLLGLARGSGESLEACWTGSRGAGKWGR